jgi:hypothetical protein
MLKSNANITQQSGAIVASAVDLCTTNGGSIGSLLSPVQTQAVDLKLVASGNVFVSELNGVTLANSKAGGQFSLSSGGPLTTSSVETSNGSITLTANGGLRVSPLSLIYANEGNITLRDSNTSTGSIKIGTLSAIFAYTTGHPNKGNVSILIGPDPVAPVKEGPHQWVVGVKHNGGQIFWGANGIKGTLLPNFVFALGRNVVFNTGTRPASAIELQGGVTITADPPFTASAPISASLTPQQTSHSSNPINAKEFLPVAFVQPTVGTVSGSRSGDACIANQRLFSPSRDITVQSGDCEVSIRAGSVVLITEGPVTKIANVFEQAANSVQVSYRHQQPVKVACGNEVAFASNAAEINQALGKDSIGRRNVRNYELSGGALTRCEVSMVSLMQNSHALRDLLHSNNPKDRATAAKLMKMAACVMMTTTNRGSYKQAR